MVRAHIRRRRLGRTGGPAEDEDPGGADGLAHGNVGRRPVADDGGGLGRDVQTLEHGGDHVTAGLAHHRFGSATRAGLQGGEHRCAVGQSAVSGRTEWIGVGRDDRRPALAHRAIARQELGVGEGPIKRHDDHVGGTRVVGHGKAVRGEAPADLVLGDRQHCGAGVGLPQVTDQGIDRGDDLRGVGRDAQARQPLGVVAGGMQRMVGDEGHPGSVGAQLGDRLVGAGNQLVIDVDRAVEIEDVGIEPTEAGARHSPPPSAPTRAISASTSAGSHLPMKKARSAIVKRSRIR